MSKDDRSGGGCLSRRKGWEGIRVDGGVGLFHDVMELRCMLTVSVGWSQLNFNFPDATNFYRNRLGTSVARRRR